MISDIRRLPNDASLNADICIIGGGAAAIAIALRLSASSLKVAIFESGGRGPDEKTAELSVGAISGLPYSHLHESHVRALGGSTYRWGARSSPMKPLDFEHRDWVDMSGWPIGLDDLAPYDSAVHDLIGLRRPFHYDGKVFASLKTIVPKFDPAVFDIAAFQFGKTLIFGEAFEPALAASANIDVYLHAVVTDVSLDPNGRQIESVTVSTLDGVQFTATAKAFILACGGIENPRLLLNWNKRNSAGLCNENGHVGRYFMEHPTVVAGTVRTEDRTRLCDVFIPGLVGGRYIETGLAPAPKFQQEHGILNAVARIRPVVIKDATQALREIIWNATHRKIPLNPGWYRNPWLRERLSAISQDPLSIPLNVIRHLMGKPKRFKSDSIVLEIRTEQAPNPESRVTLTGETDQFGLRRPDLHWAMTPMDKHTIRVMTNWVDSELKRLGLGSVESHDWLAAEDSVWPPDLIGGYHHMGTTRMSAGPAEGVVDSDCKAHSLDNLYIAGSSVFPTASFVNPTYTILGLATRLADHLKARLAK